ncbi:hypothetical protein P4N68_09385 [Corynebacterium felinum]|nr:MULTISPECIES: hypothetical protein [Corynebacterium]MDF5821287.1 hypothetical protein [Corynebacterium felinum]MDO4762517.1 hypothetical protein [Corynebacterium sp.]WJY94192.1 hypothetical protein CFELI_02750 [Corynebacterium felinum]
MRAQGIFFFILGIVLLVVSYFLLGAHDVSAILGALALAGGGASIVASMVYLFGKKDRLQ